VRDGYLQAAFSCAMHRYIAVLPTHSHLSISRFFQLAKPHPDHMRPKCVTSARPVSLSFVVCCFQEVEGQKGGVYDDVDIQAYVYTFPLLSSRNSNASSIMRYIPRNAMERKAEISPSR
jgi:hypothetical protein